MFLKLLGHGMDHSLGPIATITLASIIVIGSPATIPTSIVLVLVVLNIVWRKRRSRRSIRVVVGGVVELIAIL